MILTADSAERSSASETALEFASRLWLRTAVAVWLFWLGGMAAAVLVGAEIR